MNLLLENLKQNRLLLINKHEDTIERAIYLRFRISPLCFSLHFSFQNSLPIETQNFCRVFFMLSKKKNIDDVLIYSL